MSYKKTIICEQHYRTEKNLERILTNLVTKKEYNRTVRPDFQAMNIGAWGRVIWN